jgi:phospholipid-translocating ATPase
MIITNASGVDEIYEILHIFPFSSETKRMGIVVRHTESKRLVFYLKGADVIMKQFLPEVQRGFVDEECDDLAREGLRTLVITQKLVDEDFY